MSPGDPAAMQENSRQAFSGGKYCAVCRRLFGIGDAIDRCPSDGTPLTIVWQSPFAGAAIGKQYEILELLGCGGWAVVFKARQIALNRFVAVKMLRTHLLTRPDIAERFSREACLASQLSHRNIIATIDFGTLEDGSPYIIMEHIAGSNLDEILYSHGRLSLEATQQMFSQACDGLAAAHAQKIIHRDIKPSNLRVLNFGTKEMTVKVMDFGLAKAIEDSSLTGNKLTMTGYTIGTPTYMSPELCRGEVVDERADVYSLGCVLYEMLTGRAPIEGSNAFDTMHRHITQTPAPFEAYGVNLPPYVEAVVLKALAKEPEERYASVTEFHAAFDQCVKHALSPGGASLRNLISPLVNLIKRQPEDSHRSPVPAQPPPAATVSPEPAAVPANSRDLQAQLSGDALGVPQILVVDSNESDCKLALLKLQILGMSSQSVCTAAEAIAAVRARTYAAVLLDPSAPGVVAETAAQLRKFSKSGRQTMPVIAMVGRHDPGFDASSWGFDDVMYKPLSPAEIRKSLRRWLVPKSDATPAATPAPAALINSLASAVGSEPDEHDTLAMMVDFETTTLPEFGNEETAPLHVSEEPINIGILRATYGDETTRDLLEVFVSTAERLLELMEDARQRQRQTALQLLAHQLKGAASAVGAAEIVRLSGAMEAAAACADSLQVRIVFEGLKWSTAKMTQFVRSQSL